MANSPQLKPKIETAPTSSSVEVVETSAPQPQNALVHRTVGGCEEFRSLVEQYPWSSKIMLAIMRAESGCNPNSDNTGLNRDGSNDKGLFQINSIHGFSDAERLDPIRNIEIAFKIWRNQGYRAWAAYNNGAYLKFI